MVSRFGFLSKVEKTKIPCVSISGCGTIGDDRPLYQVDTGTLLAMFPGMINWLFGR